jgi:tetratricopeptide (TPR) repeat protein
VNEFGKRLAVSLLFGLVAAGSAAGDGIGDCFSDDNERRIAGCSEIIDMPGLDAGSKSLAYAMRALAYSLKGLYDRALPDYDMAIRLDPASAIALNNRAWALFKLKRAEKGLDDVERSLVLAPGSPHAHDTRAHIHQALGNAPKALADYERAMRFGGERLIKLYQCGLQAEGLYAGSVDGLYTSQVRRAFEACVKDRSCDPLPADEECRNPTS